MSDFKAKMHQITALPRLPGFKGPTSRGVERMEGVGAPFNFLPPGTTDMVMPLVVTCNY